MRKPRIGGALLGQTGGLGKLHLRLPHGAIHGVETKTPGTLRASGGFALGMKKTRRSGFLELERISHQDVNRQSDHRSENHL